MATVTVHDDNRVLSEPLEISEYLDRHGIWYRRFEGSDALPEDASNEDILRAYEAPINELKEAGGYVTADVINVTPDTPGLDAMLEKFQREHWHDDDEVRFITKGRGMFYIHPRSGPVFSIEVVRGDMINVPKGTWHWFHLCEDRTIRAIRLFQDPAGWTPRYTDSGEDERRQSLCMGPSDIPPGAGSH